MADGTERRNKSILLNSHPGANSANTTTMFLYMIWVEFLRGSASLGNSEKFSSQKKQYVNDVNILKLSQNSKH